MEMMLAGKCCAGMARLPVAWWSMHITVHGLLGCKSASASETYTWQVVVQLWMATGGPLPLVRAEWNCVSTRVFQRQLSRGCVPLF